MDMPRLQLGVLRPGGRPEDLLLLWLVELVKTFTEKRAELKEVCERLNPVYAEFRELKRKRDSIMAYWKQQKRRGYISSEEYDALDSLFEGAKDRKEAE